MRGHLTEKADVFGFGIVALEILSGRPNSDNSLEDGKIYLLEWAWALHENNQSLDLVDPNLVELDENEALRVMGVALLCTQGSPTMRPPMSRVVAMLAGDIEVNGVIKRPSYLTDWDFKDLTGSFMTEDTQNSIASENIDNNGSFQHGVGLSYSTAEDANLNLGTKCTYVAISLFVKERKKMIMSTKTSSSSKCFSFFFFVIFFVAFSISNAQIQNATTDPSEGNLFLSLYISASLQNPRNIDQNFFIGPLPAFIGNMSRLTLLSVAHNSLSGPIPKEIGNLKDLYLLSLGVNNFCGTLPPELGNLVELQQLYINSCGFTGEIPSTFANLRNLQTVGASDNAFTGKIHDFVGNNWTKLQSLVLRNVLLNGSIPTDIVEFQSLQKLDLSFNNLTGQIPSELFNMNSLTYLFLGNSSLSGTLPSQKSQSLKDIGFPCNRNAPRYANFAIKCGGPQMIADGILFEAENSTLGAATFNVTSTQKWAVSNVGLYEDGESTTSRISPLSLRYYGLGLENGPYSVNLFFAETAYPDRSTQSSKSLGRRVFYIYIQGSLKVKDFDISKEAGGAERAIARNFTANVTENHLEIHLFWAGKGTCCVPELGYYGPSISAISVVPDFIPTVSGLPPGSSNRKNQTALIACIIVPVGVAALILICVIIFIKRRKEYDDDEEVLLAIGPRPNTFSYAELKAATEDFSPSNKLGEGGFGAVYKDTLSDGRVVAVKQLSVASHQGKGQFIAEVATISAVQHRNLVKLYGCCIEGKRHLLVYEYLENKSLDQALFGRSDLHLDWATRFNICLATARGLAYLHEESRPRIVHRDVKASNILLDAELCPKISDFGLAKLYDDKKTHISTRVAGTIGYLAPEYAMRGHLTEKADVFGFGIVALEILSGRPNSDNSLEDDKIYLLEW
ncbi:Protein kinase domain - like 10 [Theobroma cacao]|nr:Protein kinase domain - like 10 [Theobroma cacao]